MQRFSTGCTLGKTRCDAAPTSRRVGIRMAIRYLARDGRLGCRCQLEDVAASPVDLQQKGTICKRARHRSGKGQAKTGRMRYRRTLSGGQSAQPDALRSREAPQRITDGSDGPPCRARRQVRQSVERGKQRDISVRVASSTRRPSLPGAPPGTAGHALAMPDAERRSSSASTARTTHCWSNRDVE